MGGMSCVLLLKWCLRSICFMRLECLDRLDFPSPASGRLGGIMCLFPVRSIHKRSMKQSSSSVTCFVYVLLVASSG